MASGHWPILAANKAVPVNYSAAVDDIYEILSFAW